jgi:hypothetical protein
MEFDRIEDCRNPPRAFGPAFVVGAPPRYRAAASAGSGH